MDKSEKSQLWYSCTNENLDAIMAGLNIGSVDRVLSVAGSGDQPLAMIEKAAHVFAVDSNLAQIDFVLARVKAIASGNYYGANCFISRGCYDGCIKGSKSSQNARELTKRRNTYFWDENRLDRIRAQLKGLEVKQGDILELVQDIRGFSKVYLSNVLGFGYTSNMKEAWINELLSKVADGLPRDGLIYVANHNRVSFMALSGKNNRGIRLDKGFIEDSSFLPSSLCLDKDLTILARNYERDEWHPAIYRKK